MQKPKPHIFLKSIIGCISIMILSSYIVIRAFKEKKDFFKTTGTLVYLNTNFQEWPVRHFGKYRYLQVDNHPKTFELFIGKESGDFQARFEQIDSLRIGDVVDLYYDIDEKETDPRLNRLLQYIDKDSKPNYIRGDTDKYFGLGGFGVGLLGLLALIFFKQKGKIE